MLYGQKSSPLMTVGAASGDESTPINGAFIPHFCMQPKQNPMAMENPRVFHPSAPLLPPWVPG